MKASSHNYAKEESMEEDRQHHQIQNYPIEKAELHTERRKIWTRFYDA